ALRDAERQERVREAVRERFELSIGQAHVAEDDRDVLGMARGAVRQHLIVRDSRVVEGRPEEFGVHRARARSRSVYFWTLAVEVVGRSPNTTVLGTAKCGRLSRQKTISASEFAWPSGRGCAPAQGVSPDVG